MVQDPNMAHVNGALRELEAALVAAVERIRRLEEEVAALRRQVPDVR
jgi:uncharacterized protein (UPF0335 family)